MFVGVFIGLFVLVITSKLGIALKWDILKIQDF